MSQVTQTDINKYIHNYLYLDAINCTGTTTENSLNNIKILELIHIIYSNLSITIDKLHLCEIIFNSNNHNFT